MKIEDLVGKLAIRIEPRFSPASGGLAYALTDRNPDASYCTEPVMIEAVENGIAFYRSEPNGRVRILSPIYRDDKWAMFPERLAAEFYKPSPGPEKG